MNSPSQPSSENWPTTVEDAVKDIIARMSESDKDMLRKMPKERVMMLHFGLGMQIRNRYGLLRGNELLLRAACGRHIFCNADEASSQIVKAVRDALQAAKG